MESFNKRPAHHIKDRRKWMQVWVLRLRVRSSAFVVVCCPCVTWSVACLSAISQKALLLARCFQNQPSCTLPHPVAVSRVWCFHDGSRSPCQGCAKVSPKATSLSVVYSASTYFIDGVSRATNYCHHFQCARSSGSRIKLFIRHCKPCFQFLFLMLKRVHACKFVHATAWRMQLVKDMRRCFTRKHLSVAVRFKTSPRRQKATTQVHCMHTSSLMLLSSGQIFSQSSKGAVDWSSALWHHCLFLHNGKKWLQKQLSEVMDHCYWEKNQRHSTPFWDANAC